MIKLPVKFRDWGKFQIWEDFNQLFETHKKLFKRFFYEFGLSLRNLWEVGLESQKFIKKFLSPVCEIQRWLIMLAWNGKLLSTDTNDHISIYLKARDDHEVLTMWKYSRQTASWIYERWLHFRIFVVVQNSKYFYFVFILYFHFTLWRSARTLQCLFAWGRVMTQRIRTSPGLGQFRNSAVVLYQVLTG